MAHATAQAAAAHLAAAAAQAEHSMAEYMDVDLTARSRLTPAIPPAGHGFVGQWRHVKSEAYGDFLSECVGLSWAIKKIGERIHPTPMFHIRDGQLVCETVCLGADPVLETFAAGPSIIDEPNLGLRYEVEAWWEADDTVFVAARRNETVNGGRPIVKRVYIEPATGELHIDTSWGGSVDFNARFSREQRS